MNVILFAVKRCFASAAVFAVTFALVGCVLWMFRVDAQVICVLGLFGFVYGCLQGIGVLIVQGFDPQVAPLEFLVDVLPAAREED